jgi:hypothetical protein
MQQNIGDQPLKTDLWRRARTQAKGVTIYKPTLVQPGYTLYTSGDGGYARLINMKGQIVHQWHKPYSKAFPNNTAVKNPQPDDMIYMRRAKLLPNGDLLAVYISGNDTPWGYGMVKLSPDSKVIWRYNGHTHHDIDLTNQGRIIALTHDFTSQPTADMPFLPETYLEDFLVTLSPDGKQLQKLSLTRMLAQSPYVIDAQRAEPYFAGWDPIHPNTVDWLDAKQIKTLGFGKPGDILVMLRNINMLTLVDPKAKRIVWAMRGPWLDPHDPRLLPDGNLLVFDNLGRLAPKDSRTRITEVNPHNAAIEWSYTGNKKHPLNSFIRGMDQRLPNGNTLITDSDGGQIREVTPNGKIAWLYTNPIRAGKDNGYIPVVSGAMRIDPKSLDPKFRATLKPAHGPPKSH